MLRDRSAVVLCALGLCVLLAPALHAQSEQTDDGAPVTFSGTCPTDICPATPPTLITGTLGSCGDWADCTSGTQTGRLNRNGVGSTCTTPKVCDIFVTDPGRAYDAYTISNGSGSLACVTTELTVLTQTACNLQVNTYLGSFNDADICENYLADPGVSSGTPPAVSSMCAEVPDADDLVVVVHTTNPGEIDCDYEIRLLGDCIPVELTEFKVD